MVEPKTWNKNEIIELMLKSVRDVALHCAQLGQAYKIEDAIEQVFEDLDEAGLIERQP